MQQGLDQCITRIADENKHLDGVVTAAGIQQVTEAVDYREEDVSRMLAVNYTGVFDDGPHRPRGRCSSTNMGEE